MKFKSKISKSKPNFIHNLNQMNFIKKDDGMGFSSLYIPLPKPLNHG